MAIGSNSYGSTAGVLAFTRHLLDGQESFNSTTRPTLAEVEEMIDRASAALNVALAGAGLAVPIDQADAKLACDEWVIARVVGLVELTRQAQGWSGDEGSRAGGFLGLSGPARGFARRNALAFKRLGCAVADASAQGLTFTAGTAPEDRADPDDASLAQPRFHRDMFDGSCIYNVAARHAMPLHKNTTQRYNAMSYATGESNALAILRNSSYFDSANSASLANNTPAGGYGLLDSGAAPQYAFLRPGAFHRAPSTLARLTTTWTTVIELWVRYADPSAYQALAAVRASVLSVFDQYTALDDMAEVTRSLVSAGGSVRVESSPGGGARYLRQDLTLVWEEESAPSLAD